MKKPAETKMRKKILVKALSKNLDKMSKSAYVRSLKDGKDLICPHCDQPVQPCKSEPSVMCDRMLRAGTDGHEIEKALKQSDQYDYCLSCGERISLSYLKKHPTAELCPHCTSKGHRLAARRSAHL
jgi:RNA polymerase-binding transcription factor DksA